MRISIPDIMSGMSLCSDRKGQHIRALHLEIFEAASVSRFTATGNILSTSPSPHAITQDGAD